MLTFQDILLETNWDDVKSAIEKLYPNDIESIDGFKNVYYTLLSLEPIQNNDNIFIDIRFIKDDLNEYYSVSGKIPNDETFYGIEYDKWEEWLGYYIDNNLLNNMDKTEIVAHCLWEMTWGGFTQEEIQNHINYLNKLIEETKKEKDKKYKSEGYFWQK